MATETITKGVELPTEPQAVNTAVSGGFYPVGFFHDTWDFEENENQTLALKLDTLRGEPTKSFGSSKEAINYLRSRTKSAR